MEYAYCVHQDSTSSILYLVDIFERLVYSALKHQLFTFFANMCEFNLLGFLEMFYKHLLIKFVQAVGSTV